jgi:hypothetical protein
VATGSGQIVWSGSGTENYQPPGSGGAKKRQGSGFVPGMLYLMEEGGPLA